MVLEATMICLDYSEWMRNGDYTPTRLEAQRDAVISICLSKLRSNPESCVGILRSSGRGIEVLATLTTDSGRLLSSMHDHNVTGSFDFVSALQVAQLGLKHRQNKNQQQRIIIFIGSPVTVDVNTLKDLGKKLQKNSIAVDIINFGEETENIEKLEAFISSVNYNENSHLLTIPPGPHNLSDGLYSSPILESGEGMGFEGAVGGGGERSEGGAGGGGGGGFDFGVDPSLDPELAMALRLSLEEERARQQRNQQTSEPDSGSNAPPAGEASVPAQASAPSDVNMAEDGEEEEEDPDLAQALALSVQTHQQDLAKQGQPETEPKAQTKQDTDVEMDDDEMQQALAMSLQQGQSSTQPSSSLQDPQFLSNVLSTLPGLDPNDPQIQEVLSSLGKQPEEKKDDKDNQKK